MELKSSIMSHLRLGHRKSYRAKDLAQCAHTLFTIIPFEEKWFKDRGVKRTRPAVHPLCLEYQDELPTEAKKYPEETMEDSSFARSRRGEVSRMLPVFLKSIEKLRRDYQVQVGIVKVSHLSPNLYSGFDRQFDQVWYQDELKEACFWADLSFTCSGTVTLATDLLGLPSLVCYDSTLLNRFVFDTFINYEWYASLFNIVHEEEVFRSFSVTGFPILMF